MKKALMIIIVTVLMVQLFCTTTAEVLTIDLENASYEDITAMLSLLENERKERLLENFKNEHDVSVKSTISFREIPWYTTKKDVESIIGGPNQYRHGYIHNTQSQVHTNDIGVATHYKNWTVAGYPVDTVELNYVYPVRDNILLNNSDYACLYLATYTMRSLGDPNAAKIDLENKLTTLYGNYSIEDNDLVWKDESQNTIIMHHWNSTIEITYYAGETELWLVAAEDALDCERAKQEEISRLQNSNNYDGL